MNKFIQAVTSLDIEAVQKHLQPGSRWIGWSEKSGKNALHYLCRVNLEGDREKQAVSLKVLKLLLDSGLDINSVQEVQEKECIFPATPVWYAYTHGRNETLYKWLLKNGARPDNCMFAIAWYDDDKAADLFKKSGLGIHDTDGKDTPFLSAIAWKKIKMARWLLKNGADVDFTDPKGRTALYYAIQKQYDVEFVRELLKYGADPDKMAKDGLSPRMVARKKGTPAVRKLLKV